MLASALALALAEGGMVEDGGVGVGVGVSVGVAGGMGAGVLAVDIVVWLGDAGVRWVGRVDGSCRFVRSWSWCGCGCGSGGGSDGSVDLRRWKCDVFPMREGSEIAPVLDNVRVLVYARVDERFWLWLID